MTALYLTLLLPLAGTLLLAVIGHLRTAGWVNLLFTVATFAARCGLPWTSLRTGP